MHTNDFTNDKSFLDNLLSFHMHMRGTYFRVYIVLSPDHLKMDKIIKRKPNWSNEEIEVLVQCVTDNIRLIKGKFTPSITNEAKNRCWVEITSQEVCDVKKKWQDLSSQIKKNVKLRGEEGSMPLEEALVSLLRS